MSELFFWKNWRTNYRSLYLFALLSLLTAILLFIVQYALGAGAVIRWQTVNQLQDTAVPLDTFTEGLFTFSTEVTTFFLKEKFVATPLTVNVTAAHLYAFLLALGITLALSVLSILPRLWYVASIGAFILMLASFKLDLLQVATFYDNALFIGAVVFYAGLSYYFHAFRTHVPVPVQWFGFAMLTLFFAAIILIFSPVELPVLSLIGYGSIVPILLTLIFTFSIGHEIVRGFLFLITQQGGISGKNSTLHFTLITVFYLANLVLAYLHNTSTIQWDLLYIDAFYVYLLSLIIGLWGLKKRSVLFESILPFAPHGAILYVALAIISTATMGYFFATANDPMVEMFEDWILFSHLAMGTGFYIYVLSNFLGPMSQGLPVYRIVYQPNRFLFAYVRALALIMILALLLQANMFPFYQSLAGYYNGLGDAYTAQKEYGVAEEYYRLGTRYEFQNHKSNYSLASLAQIQGDRSAAAYFYKQALLKNPTPFTYANLSHLYAQESLLFESMFALREGVRRFPQNGELHNNLALVYHQTDIADSAYIYYDLARRHVSRPEVVQTNLLAFWVQNNAVTELDSLLEYTAATDHLPLMNNRLVLGTMHGARLKTPYAPEPLTDSLLTRERFAYLYNYILNQKDQADTAIIRRLLAYETNPSNFIFGEDLRLAHAAYEYYGNDKREGFQLLRGMLGQTNREPYFSRILGLWWMREGAYQLAAQNFERAIQNGDSTLLTNYAIALSKDQRWADALPVWQELSTAADAETRETAIRMQSIGRALQSGRPAAAAATLDDAGKALLVHFSEDTPLPGVPAGISTPEYRAIAHADLARHYLRQGQLAPAEIALQTARQSSPLSEPVRWRLNELNLQLLQARQNYSALLSAADTAALGPETAAKKTYFTAVAYTHTDRPAQAADLYNRALKRLPVNSEVVRQAGQYIDSVQNNPDKAYTVLLEAIRLNPYSADLMKAYILQSLDMYLFTYAAEALEQLRGLTTPADYQTFLPKYEAKKASVEKSLSDWE